MLVKYILYITKSEHDCPLFTLLDKTSKQDVGEDMIVVLQQKRLLAP